MSDVLSEIKKHKVHYYLEVEGHKECIKCYAIKIAERALSSQLQEREPMGVSQWKEYGKKYGYWKYFEDESL